MMNQEKFDRIKAICDKAGLDISWNRETDRIDVKVPSEDDITEDQLSLWEREWQAGNFKPLMDALNAQDRVKQSRRERLDLMAEPGYGRFFDGQGLADLPGKRKHLTNANGNYTFPAGKRKRGFPGRGH